MNQNLVPTRERGDHCGESEGNISYKKMAPGLQVAAPEGADATLTEFEVPRTPTSGGDAISA